MNPWIDTETLAAYADDELDAMTTRDLDARIDADDALRARLETLRQLRRAVSEAAEYHVAPASLRARILAIDPPPEAPTMPVPRAVARSTSASWLRWPTWRLLGASFAALAVAAIGLGAWRERAGADDRLAQDVVASHVRATLGEHLVDVESSDHHTVKPWLSSKLDFSPPVPDSPLPGSPFIGGRVDYLDGHPVAALVFRHGNHVVDSFVWPVDSADRAVVTTTERGFRIARWTRARMTHWTISDVSREEFDAIVRRLSTAD